MRATPRVRENLGAGAMKAWAPIRVEKVRRAAVFILERVVELTIVWSVWGGKGRSVSAMRGGRSGHVINGCVVEAFAVCL